MNYLTKEQLEQLTDDELSALLNEVCESEDCDYEDLVDAVFCARIDASHAANVQAFQNHHGILYKSAEEKEAAEDRKSAEKAREQEKYTYKKLRDTANLLDAIVFSEKED
jgi:hypothetical protein